MDEKKKDDEIEIDFGRLFGIIVEKKRIMAGIVSICTIVAMIYSLILPPTYESNTLVQTSNAGKLDLSGSASTALSLLTGGSGATSSTKNYMEMMKTRAVIEPIIDQMDDIPAEQRDNMSAEGFANEHLTIENVKGTNLIRVTAKGRTPEEAQMLSSSVVDNFLKLMTEMNQSSQSYMVKFINERIDATKKESDEAEHKLDEYSRAYKVYLPEDQARALLEQTAVYDKAIGDFQVQQQAAAAKIAAVKSELAKQNANISAYNVADNEVVVSLRSQIASQEVDIVKLEQRYTENHPELVSARETLESMKATLSREVAEAVAAGTSSMNATQSALAQELAEAQVEMSVASASEAAVKAQCADSESDMEQLSENTVEYLKLKRDAEIKNEVYIALVKQSEQAKVQATMESMDIQVIDKANLPTQKSAPRRTMITVVGMGVGVVICLIYGFWLYRKEEYGSI